LVIVPSISETTTRSVDSQTKIRAVVADAPVADKEKVIEFAPGLKFNDFCDCIQSWEEELKISPTSWSDVSRNVFAYFFVFVGGIARAGDSKVSSTGLRRDVEGSLLASKPTVLFDSGLSVEGSGSEDEDPSPFQKWTNEYISRKTQAR
jgi:hypothetical protein